MPARVPEAFGRGLRVIAATEVIPLRFKLLFTGIFLSPYSECEAPQSSHTITRVGR